MSGKFEFDTRVLQRKAEAHEEKHKRMSALSDIPGEELMSLVQGLIEYVNKKEKVSNKVCERKFSKLYEKYPSIFETVLRDKSLDMNMLQKMIELRDYAKNGKKEAQEAAGKADTLLSNKYIYSKIDKK